MYPSAREMAYPVQQSFLESLLRDKEGRPVDAGRLPHMTADDLDNTVMLLENNRMNKALNDFTRRLYNRHYLAANPQRALGLIDQEDEKMKALNRLSQSCLVPMFYENQSCTATICVSPVSSSGFPVVFSHESQLQYESRLIERLIDGLLLLNQSPPSIFVVVPHRAQRASLQALLVKEKYQNLTLKADTVDRMQGQEAEIVIISYLFLDALQVSQEASFLFDRRRINVSISRAQSCCIFVASESVLDPPIEVIAEPALNDAFRHVRFFTEICEEKKCYFHLTASQENLRIYDNYEVSPSWSHSLS